MHRCPETKGHVYGQKLKGHVSIGVWSMSSKSGDKRTYVWAKARRTCVLLAIGEQEREIQNAQVNFIRQKKVICRSASSSGARS